MKPIIINLLFLLSTVTAFGQTIPTNFQYDTIIEYAISMPMTEAEYEAWVKEKEQIKMIDSSKFEIRVMIDTARFINGNYDITFTRTEGAKMKSLITCSFNSHEKITPKNLSIDIFFDIENGHSSYSIFPYAYTSNLSIISFKNFENSDTVSLTKQIAYNKTGDTTKYEYYIYYKNPDGIMTAKITSIIKNNTYSILLQDNLIIDIIGDPVIYVDRNKAISTKAILINEFNRNKNMQIPRIECFETQYKGRTSPYHFIVCAKDFYLNKDTYVYLQHKADLKAKRLQAKKKNKK